MLCLFLLVSICAFGTLALEDKHVYEPEWSDLDKRPLPQWYDRAKIGVFLHWGVYSVPAYKSEWFWKLWRIGDRQISNFMHKNFAPGFTYQEFAPMLKAEQFDPIAWAELFKRCGIKYVVLTSKHHDGYALFPAQRSFSWNSVDIGPHRDLVGELSSAIRKEGLEFGVYHSLYEWYNPMYMRDRKNSYCTHVYRDEKLWPELKQLIIDYRPSVLWSDGDWEAPDTYWNSTRFLAWLYNESPVGDHIVVNDRWGKGTSGKHGDFFNFDDRYNQRKLEHHKWENAFTLDKFSWGYRNDMTFIDVLSNEKLIEQIVTTVSCGGNALINVGPTKEGTIVTLFQERLLTLGEWLKVNGEAIYATSPWLYQNDTLNGNVWYTCNNTQYNAAHPTAKPNDEATVATIYAIYLKWPENGLLRLGAINVKKHWKMELLDKGRNHYLRWTSKNGVGYIKLPSRSSVKSSYAWVLKITPKSSQDLLSNAIKYNL